MNLTERMPRLSKVIKAKVGYFEEKMKYETYSGLFTLSCLPHNSMCYFIVVTSSVLIYNVENNEKPLNKRVCPNLIVSVFNVAFQCCCYQKRVDNAP